MQVKLKIAKDDTIYFDGTWLSNGYWAARADKIELSDKELMALVNAGVTFSRRMKEIALVGKEDLPDFAALIQGACPMKDEHLLHQLPWIYQSREDAGHKLYKIFRRSDGRLVPFFHAYQALFDAFSIYQQESERKTASLYEDEEFVGLIMPCALEYLESDMRRLTSPQEA
jgi:hypothetical protein